MDGRMNTISGRRLFGGHSKLNLRRDAEITVIMYGLRWQIVKTEVIRDGLDRIVCSSHQPSASPSSNLREQIAFGDHIRKVTIFSVTARYIHSETRRRFKRVPNPTAESFCPLLTAELSSRSAPKGLLIISF